MGEPAIGTRKWTRLEYDRLVEAEILGSEDRIELLGGQMIVKEPQYSPHAAGVRLVQRALEGAFGTGWDVRPQMPVALDEESEPEPDICVVPGHPRDYRDAHPERCDPVMPHGAPNRLAEFARSIVPAKGVAPNHGWRHTFVTRGREAGIEDRVLDGIGGWAPASEGRKYGGVTIKAQAKALAKFPRYQVDG